MRSFNWIRTMPALAILIAAMAAYTGGCGGGGDGDKPNPSTGGSGGGGTGGTGGTGGVGGTGGGNEVVPCEVDEDCPTSEERCDEVEKICVPKCKRDRDCGLNTGLRCDEDSGLCIPGEPCDQSINCGTSRDHDYCKGHFASCYCQEDQTMQKEEDAFGVCWRTAKICDECETAEQCGGADNYACRAFNYGGETRDVCLRKASTGSCPPGTIRGEGEFLGLCVPQYNDCRDFAPCMSNEDCNQLNPICDLSRQICVPGCTFDYDKNRTQGCAPQQVCHSTERNTDPRLIGDCTAGFLWGLGECGPACEEDSHCSRYGEGFVCETYGTENRCVPAAAARKADPENPNSERIGCMSDEECQLNDPSTPLLGYCDLTTFTCVTDGCRMGDDWRIGCKQPFTDCDNLHKCVRDPEVNDPEKGMCVEKDCIDMGGAGPGCMRGEFCANEQYRDLFTGELLEDKDVTPPAGVDYGECFPMNESSWCVPCSEDTDCAGLASLTDSEFPPVCVDFGDAGKWCAPGCDYQQECPSRWQCRSHQLTTCGMQGRNEVPFCADDEDCPGSSKCVTPTVGGSPWIGPDNLVGEVKICKCDPDEANSCGPNYVCNAGIATKTDAAEEVVENYCTAKDLCGPKGSCEFFGHTAAINPDFVAAVFVCGNSYTDIPGLDVKCPEGSFPGGNYAERYLCINSQVCYPSLNTEGTCGLDPEPEE